MSGGVIVMWFRRDLRLSDNTALNAAIESKSQIVPVFVVDPILMKSERTGTPRAAFLLNALRSLNQSLQDCGSSLRILRGRPSEVLAQFIEDTGAAGLYLNADYSPYARKRDVAVTKSVQVPVHQYHDLLLVAPGDVMKADGDPYVVFTPFKKKWLDVPKSAPDVTKLDQKHFADVLGDTNEISSLGLEDLGFNATIDLPEASEAEASRRLAQFVDGPVYDYENGRNRLAAEPTHEPAAGSSFLSPYLHLGLLSIRQAYQSAQDAREKASIQSARESVDTWISELAWRDFYYHILYHFPQVTKQNFRSAYDSIKWLNDDDDFQAWKEGVTGYPIVDAAMRQLRQEGWMPNRARMIVASFLTKDLLVDWRKGELHFMQCLIDGDLAANNGGWQWAAGTGTDAQPYFRIFNPVSQSEKFDPEGTYIKRWIPELRDVPTEFIHTPWEMDEPPADYPAPIVDHSSARERALDAYKSAKNQD